MTALKRYERMTPGPARRIVTELPRNRPTPMAPPMVIMVSWRCVRLRLSSDERPVAVSVGGAGCLLTPNHLTQHLSELVNLLDGVVVDYRRAVDAGVESAAETVHQPWRVHVSVANA